MSKLLTVQNLSIDSRQKGGEHKRIVDDVSFSVEHGSIVALIGESGAGKTTLALSALGFLREGTEFVSGSVLFNGANILAIPTSERRRLRGKRICYVAQSAQASLNPSLTIGKQICEAMLVHERTGLANARARALQLLELLDLPDPPALMNRFPHQLSGGQQQRIMLVMAMATNPELLILDEPTTALDVTTQLEVLRAIRSMVAHLGCAVIYVSHDLAVVAQLADHVVVLRHGRIVEQCEIENLLAAPTQEYSQRLIAAVPRKPALGGVKPDCSRGTDIAAMAAVPRQLLRVSDVAANYGSGSPVLQDISFHVHPGEILAIVGESGSGKSTLGRVVAGLHPPSSGTIELDGRVLPAAAGSRSLQDLRHIQIVFQSPDLSLNPEQKVGEAIGRPLKLYFSLSRKDRQARIEQLLDMVGLPRNFSSRYPSELSGGERQRVSLARAFAAEPTMIICDEALASLDTVVAASMLALMVKLQKETGVSYLFISHDLSTVWRIANRILVLYKGEICGLDTPQCLLDQPHHAYIDLLIGAVPELRTDWLDEISKTEPPARVAGE